MSNVIDFNLSDNIVLRTDPNKSLIYLQYLAETAVEFISQFEPDGFMESLLPVLYGIEYLAQFARDGYVADNFDEILNEAREVNQKMVQFYIESQSKK